MEKRLINYSKVPFPVVLMSLLVSFFIDIKGINWALAYGFFPKREGGFMSLLYSFTTVTILYLYLYNKRKYEFTPNRSILFLCFFLILLYFFTSNLIGTPRVSIIFFLLFTIVGMLIPHYSIVNSRILIKGIMFWTCFAILRLDHVFIMSLSWSEVISMDASYAFLPPILANIIYLFTYYKDEGKYEKIITLILTVINSVYLLQLFMYGSRGPLLSIVLAIFFIICFKYDRNYSKILFTPRKMMIIAISLFSTTVFFSLLLDTIPILSDKIGIQSHAIDKMIRLSNEDNLSNGRDDIISLALNGIMDSPLYGHGIDRFEANTMVPYPHNFILQFLYDGGVFLFLCFFIPICLRMRSIYQKCSYHEYVTYSVLFFISVPYAFFSQDLWENVLLWIFIGSIFSKTFINNNLIDHDL